MRIDDDDLRKLMNTYFKYKNMKNKTKYEDGYLRAVEDVIHFILRFCDEEYFDSVTRGD